MKLIDAMFDKIDELYILMQTEEKTYNKIRYAYSIKQIITAMEKIIEIPPISDDSDYI